MHSLLSLLFSNPLVFIVIVIGLVVSITIHEFAHAFVADKLGDPTPKYQGRVTLNPKAHLDPLGSLSLLLIGFGWGKPVQFDAYNLANPKRDIALISLAGPVANFSLAVLLSLAIGLFNLQGFPFLILTSIIFINIGLAIFNLIPVAPLDGEKVLQSILPTETALEYESFMRRYGRLVLIGLLLPWNGTASPISHLIYPVINLVTKAVSYLWVI